MKTTFLFVVFLIFGWSAIALGQTPQILYAQDFTVTCNITDWTVVSGDWTCGPPDGLLFTGQKGVIVAAPAFEGCTSCTIRTVSHLGSGRISLLGWYEDENNFVELTARPHKDGIVRWTLAQIVNGRVEARMSAEHISSGDYWDLAEIGFDGLTFTVKINELFTLFQMEKAPGSAPFGTVGYEYKHARASFAAIGVF